MKSWYIYSVESTGGMHSGGTEAWTIILDLKSGDCSKSPSLVLENEDNGVENSEG